MSVATKALSILKGITPISKTERKRHALLLDSAFPGLTGWSQYGQRWSVREREALTSSAIYACVRLLASPIARMPLRVHNRVNPIKDIDNDHIIEYLFNVRPCPAFTGHALKEWIMRKVLLRGNAYVLIDRMPGTMQTRALYPLEPERVTVQLIGGRKVYMVSLNNQSDSPDIKRKILKVDQDDMLHFHGLVYDGVIGVSVLESGALISSITDLAQSKQRAMYYKGGALSKFVLEYEGELDDDDVKSIMDDWDKNYARGVDGSNAPMIFEGKVNLKELGKSNREMQEVDIHTATIQDVLRAFGVPAILANLEEKTTSWGTGVQHIQAGFMNFTLQEWVPRLEAEIAMKFFAYSTEYAQLDPSALLRGTQTERYDNHRKSLGGGQNPGWATVNEVRVLEGLEPIDGAPDKYDMPFFPSVHTMTTDETDGDDDDTTGDGETDEPVVVEEVDIDDDDDEDDDES